MLCFVINVSIDWGKTNIKNSVGSKSHTERYGIICQRFVMNFDMIKLIANKMEWVDDIKLLIGLHNGCGLVYTCPTII